MPCVDQRARRPRRRDVARPRRARCARAAGRGAASARRSLLGHGPASHRGPADSAGRPRRRRASGAPRPQPQEELDVARRPGQRARRHRRAPQPERRGRRRRPRRTASARSAGSRTTPPAPTRSLPTSNCGLTISTRSPSGVGARRPARAAPARSEMKDRSPTTRSTGPPIGSGVELADVGAVEHGDPLVAAQRPGQLAVADVDGDHLARRRARSSTSVKPPVEAPASRQRRPVDRQARGSNAASAPASLWPPRET